MAEPVSAPPAPSGGQHDTGDVHRRLCSTRASAMRQVIGRVIAPQPAARRCAEPCCDPAIPMHRTTATEPGFPRSELSRNTRHDAPGPEVLITLFAVARFAVVLSYWVSIRGPSLFSSTQSKGAYACRCQAVPRVVLWPFLSRVGRWPPRCFSGVLQRRSPNPLPHRHPHPLAHRRPAARPPTWLRCRGL